MPTPAHASPPAPAAAVRQRRATARVGAAHGRRPFAAYVGAAAWLLAVVVGASLLAATADAQRRGGRVGDPTPPGQAGGGTGTGSGASASGGDAAARDRQAVDAEARRYFDLGAQAFAGGRFEDALDHFEASYRLSGRPALLYNIGLAQDRLRMDREAVASFERFLAEVPDTSRREEVEGRLEALRTAVRRAERQEAQAAAERERLAREAREAEERAARAAAGGRSAGAEAPTVFERWWFWAIVGAVVAGGVTAALVATHDPGTEAPIPGTGGVVVMALGGP